MSLTTKQEKFAQEVASGKSQADAYRAAFDCARSKPETVIKRASELMTNRDIAGRVDELKAQLSEKSLWKREDSVRILADIATDADASRKDKTAAVRVLNDMHGFNEPLKIEHSGTVTAITRRVVDKKAGGQ